MSCSGNQLGSEIGKLSEQDSAKARSFRGWLCFRIEGPVGSFSALLGCEGFRGLGLGPLGSGFGVILLCTVQGFFW